MTWSAALAVALYVGLLFLAAYLEVRWNRRFPRAASPPAQPLELDELELLSPREIVSMLAQLAEIGETFAEADTCAALSERLRQRLRLIECQPAPDGLEVLHLE